MTDRDTFSKSYVVPTGWLQRRFSRMYSAIGTLNSRKIGRRPRGTVMLAGFSGWPSDDETTEVQLDFSTQRLKTVAVAMSSGVQQFAIYQHADVSKVMKDLHVAANKLKALKVKK
jgi:hypothetical protein